MENFTAYTIDGVKVSVNETDFYSMKQDFNASVDFVEINGIVFDLVETFKDYTIIYN